MDANTNPQTRFAFRNVVNQTWSDLARDVTAGGSSLFFVIAIVYVALIPDSVFPRFLTAKVFRAVS